MKDEGHYIERNNGIFHLSTRLPKPNIKSPKDLFDLEG